MRVLSLCDYSGSWSSPYLESGYEVYRVDLGHKEGIYDCGDGLFTVGADVCDEEWLGYVPTTFEVVLAAPPCTTFCRPGARWWPSMDAKGETERDVRTMKRCLHLCKEATSIWALENPPGRHQKLIPELGPPAWQFHPFEYGDPWKKQTYIWGTASRPPTNPVEPEPTRRTPNGKTQGRIAFMSSSWKREREKTPTGFARAFFNSNNPKPVTPAKEGSEP